MSAAADRPTDDHLWSRARQGDPAAFGELFTRHATVVYNYCFRLTGSWNTAEDLTSVVFLEAWRRRDAMPVTPGDHVELTADGPFVPWLLELASDVARHSARSVRRHRQLLAKLPPAVLEGDANGPVEAPPVVDGTERAMKQVLRVFRRLPKHEQEVLALCVWGERSYAEAAVALGVPVGTVRSRLARARAHLQRLAEAAAPKAVEPRTGPATKGTPSR